MFAQVSNLVPGELIHVIADAHIYDRHIPIVRELIERPAYKAPKLIVDPDIKNFMISPYQALSSRNTNTDLRSEIFLLPLRAEENYPRKFESC